MLQTSVRIINLTTLSIVFKRGSIGCIFVLKHNFLQLGHDSLSKQRRSLTPRSHHVSFTTETRTTCYRGENTGRHKHVGSRHERVNRDVKGKKTEG